VSEARRHSTREVPVGDRLVGGTNPIWVQSMTNTDTGDVEATVAQIERLQEAGCEIVRVAVPKLKDVEALDAIRQRIGIPLVADIHFDHRIALAALDTSVEKIRINPGNIGGPDRFEAVVRKALQAGKTIRIGVNSGSVEKDLLEEHGWPSPEALVASALRYVDVCQGLGYDWLIVSLKSSDTRAAVAAYRQFASASDYPVHIGITEAGAAPYGTIKSAVGLGTLLVDGIGDTIRVSLVGDPVPEIAAAQDILQASGRRVFRPEVIACPTCARTDIDLTRVVAEVQRRLRGVGKPLRVAIMGCVVNGPGEAREADLGIAGGAGKGLLFKRGEVIRRVAEDEMVDALMEEIDRWDEHEQA